MRLCLLRTDIPSIPAKTNTSLSAIRTVLRTVLVACAFVGLFLVAPIALQAQTAHFAGTQSTIGSGISLPRGVAVDGSGNVYIADTYNDRVLKETLSGDSYTQSTVASSLAFPMGVAVDGSGNVYIAETYHNRVLKETLSGGSYTESTVASGLSGPYGVAVDGSGNVYIADTGNNRVLKETLSGGSYTESTIGSGLRGPYGVAVDGSGNVYIADFRNGRVLKETLSAGSYTQSTIASDLIYPNGVAVDGSGNVYIVDTGNNRVLKEALSGGSYTQSTVASGLTWPYGVAVDGSGNVYIADYDDNRVLKETLSGGSYTQSIIASGLNTPTCIAVDGSGTVYIGDTGNNRVLKEALSGSSYTQSTVASGLNYPSGVAVDGSGNVYIADAFNNRVLKENFWDPPSLNFTATPAGSASAAQDVTVLNAGNAPLTPLIISQISTTPGFILQGPNTSCSSSGQSLDPSASCVLGIEFAPTAIGSIGGSVTLTDNTLNASAATQAILLSGTATTGTPTVSFTGAPVSAGYKTKFTISATTNASTQAIITPTGPCSINGNVVTMTGSTGTCILTANWAADSNYLAATETQYTVARSIVVTWPKPAAIAYGTPLGDTQLNAHATNKGAPVSGSYAYSPVAGTVLDAGINQTLSVAFISDDGTLATATTTITVTKLPTTISWTPGPLAYGDALSSAQLNATATCNSVDVSMSGTFTYSPAAGKVLAGGSHTLSVTFTSADIDCATVKATAQLLVTAVTPTINWLPPNAIIYGTKLSGAQLDAKAAYPGVSVPGKFTYTPAAGEILTVGTQSLSSSFAPTNSANFNAPTDASQTLLVTPLTPKIKVTAPPAITYGTPLDLTKLNATVVTLAPGTSNPVDGSFLYSIDGAPGFDVTAAPVLEVGRHTITATFTATDTTDYMPSAPAITSITVTKAIPTITWNPPDPISYGTALSTTQLSASASFGGNPVSGTFTYSPAAGTVLSTGNHTLSATFKPDNGTEYGTPLKATVTLTVGKVAATISWVPSPSSMNAGAALVKGQLDARACSDSGCTKVLTGTWTYDQKAGDRTPLSAGPYTLTCTWTPTGAAATNYQSTPATVDILLLD